LRKAAKRKRPVRITAFRRIVTRANSSRRLCNCCRVLLNASYVNKTAFRGSSLIEKRSCKRRGNSERPKYQNVRVSFSSAGLSFDSVLAVGRAANWRSGWGVLSLITSFYGNGGTKFPDEVPAEQGSHALKDGTHPARDWAAPPGPSRDGTGTGWPGRARAWDVSGRRGL
jgi:hypothetical protein